MTEDKKNLCFYLSLAFKHHIRMQMKPWSTLKCLGWMMRLKKPLTFKLNGWKDRYYFQRGEKIT